MALTNIFKYSSSTHDYEIHWTSLGDPASPPLIFVHGTPWSSRVWLKHASSLANRFHVYLFDNPGFGESPLGQPQPEQKDHISEAVELDADLSRQSEVFAALYKHWASEWGSRDAHVVAHDHGGLMSLRAYLLHDCRFASLCLINVVAIGPFGKPLFELVAANEKKFLNMEDLSYEGVVDSYIRDAAFVPLEDKVMDMLKRQWVSNLDGRKGFLRQMVQANSRNTDEVEGRYSEVGLEIPVRIIWGREDRWIPVETASRLAEKLNSKDVVLIDGAGHLVMYDQELTLGVELGWWFSRVSQGET